MEKGIGDVARKVVGGVRGAASRGKETPTVSSPGEPPAKVVYVDGFPNKDTMGTPKEVARLRRNVAAAKQSRYYKPSQRKSFPSRGKKEGWKEAALLWPTQPEKNGKGHKVKTRIGDSPNGYPT
jgi:hypothetical protein